MAQIQNPGKLLTSLYNGLLDQIPARWRAKLGVSRTDQQNPTWIDPDAIAGLLIESDVQQTVLDQVKKSNTTLNDPTGVTLTEEYMTAQGQLATREVSLVPTGTSIPTITATTVSSEQTNTGLEFSEQSTATVPIVYPDELSTAKQVIQIPQKFLDSDAEITKTGTTAAGTVATPNTIGTGGTGILESDATQVDATKTRVEDTTLIGTVSTEKSEYELYQGLLVTKDVQYLDDTNVPTVGDYLTVDLNQEVFGGGKAIISKGTVAEYVPQPGQEYVENFDFIAEFTEYTEPLGTDIGTNQESIQPLDYLKSKVKQWTVPTAAIEAFSISYKTTDRIFLPDVLVGLSVIWSTAGGNGTYSETGSGAATGYTASLNMSLTGRGQGSASVMPKLVPVIKHFWSSNLPVKDYFFFMPNSMTDADLLARLDSLTGGTVNEWPVFNISSDTITLVGKKVSMSASAMARASVYLSTDPSAGTSSGSESDSSGGGEDYDWGVSMESVTLPPMVHGVIPISGGITNSLSASCSASAALTGGSNFPSPSGTGGASGTADGSVYPAVLPATSPAAFPASGLFLYTTEMQPWRFGYSTTRARIFDFASIQGVTSGVQQITEIEFTGLTGASFVTGSTGLYFTIYASGVEYIVWFNVGTETAPSGSNLIEIIVASSSSTAVQIANDLNANASILALFQTGILGDVSILVNIDYGPNTPATAGTSPVSVFTVVSGS